MQDNSDLIHDEDTLIDTGDESQEIEEESESEDESESEGEDPRGTEQPKQKVSNYVDFERDLNEQKDTIKGRLGEYHRVSMTTQRELEIVKAEKAALEAKVNEFVSKKAPPQPDVDLLIENPREFERQQREYEEHRVNERFIQEQQKAQQEREQLVKQQEINEKSTKILENAKSKGIDEKMVEAGAVFLAQTGMIDQLRGELLDNPNAAEILSLLATDEEMAAELFYKLRRDPVDARVFLRTDLKEKALNKYSKKPSAPKPTTKVSGARGSGKTVQDKYGFSVD